MKLLLTDKAFQDALSKLGDTWELSAELNDILEEFTTAMYGRGMYKSVNAARLAMLREKCGGTDGISLSRYFDLGQFPPCQKALQQHIRCTNYQIVSGKQLIYLDQGHLQQLMIGYQVMIMTTMTTTISIC